jgi:hypothetical protein
VSVAFSTSICAGAAALRSFDRVEIEPALPVRRDLVESSSVATLLVADLTSASPSFEARPSVPLNSSQLGFSSP